MTDPLATGGADPAVTAGAAALGFAETVVEAALDAVIGMDADGRVVAFNPAAEVIFGYRRSEALGRLVAELIVPPEMRERHRSALQRHQATGVAHILGHRAQMPAQRADGSRLTVELIVVDAGAGAPARYVAYLRDLTAQQRIEAELRASEAYFRSIVDDQTELVCRCDSGFELTFCNAAHARLWGQSPHELVGRNFFETIPERLRASLRAELEGLTPESPILYGENEKIFADGSVRWFEWLNRALFDPQGRLAGYQSVGRDVTERRAAADELARHREALARSERLAAFGSLLAGVAHELNNPLSILLTQAVLLHEQATDPAVLQRAERIRAAADRCARTVRSFLAIARAKPPSRGRVALPQVVRASLDLTAYGMRSSGIRVEAAFADDLPEVWADADQLGQVVLNLVVNAEQALREQGGERRLRLGGEIAGDAVRLVVSDNGPGIPAAVRASIFDPFFTTKPVGAGTGLGLSICQGIIEAHGGRIEVDETPGGGARFSVTLPMAQGEASLPPAAVESAAPVQGRILVVDDEPDQAQGLADALARPGLRIDVAYGGRQALRLAETTDYAVVVSDVRMPDIGGPALYRLLRQRPSGFAGRMVLVTGDTLDRSLDPLASDTGVVLLEKPLAPAELRRAVKAALEAAAQDPASGSKR